MNQKKDHKYSKGKTIPKLKEEKNTTSVNSSGRKTKAHSGIYFPVRIKKPSDMGTESSHEEVGTTDFSTNNNEPRNAEKEEETKITSIDNLETSMGQNLKLCDTNPCIDESVSYQCQDTTCKCFSNIKLIHAVCTPRRSTKAALPDSGKDSKESHSIFQSKSVSARQKANDVGKEEKTENARQAVCCELKQQNRRLPKLRQPGAYRCKSTSISETQHVNDMSQSKTVSSNPATQSKCASNTGPSSEPTSEFVSDSTSSSEPLLEDLNADKLVPLPEPSNMHASLPSSATASEFTNEVESRSSSRPEFWPQSAPTYEIIHALEPTSQPASNPLSPLKSEPLNAQKSESSRATESVPPSLCNLQSPKMTKIPQKCASSSRTSKIPKIHPNTVTDAKVLQKNYDNPSGSKSQGNLKQIVVKTSSYNERSTTAKTICDSNKQKQTKGNEKKVEVCQKKSCK